MNTRDQTYDIVVSNGRVIDPETFLDRQMPWASAVIPSRRFPMNHSWESTIRKASLIPAQILGTSTPMMNKGRLQVGADADLIVFDPATVADRATFKEPCQTTIGMKHVLVNGTFVIRDEQLEIDALPGKGVRRPVTA